MTGPLSIPRAAIPPIDGDDDDIVVNVDDLPDDIPNDPLPSEMQVPAGSVPDTDVDVPVIGTPLRDDQIGA